MGVSSAASQTVEEVEWTYEDASCLPLLNYKDQKIIDFYRSEICKNMFIYFGASYLRWLPNIFKTYLQILS